ncbi:SDR family NAD(P)-dependent oxidoreductase [Priestia koreensis]|uniref:glucose 1-dehydrogenase [NAD(P)(+)] n=1 Tax=Priestia koreensis TaxID=284581 RepID=A0A0M0KWY1_9BACI|nr:SDR family oxidoreductase [Priestia koreensis]KOO42893.1 short-chain dehydrogenase [Priestia koreensis]
MRFDNKVTVITGAGSGIGRATAVELGKQGAKVVLVGRTKEKLEETAALLEGNGDVFPADVTSESDVENLASYVKETYGHLDILINNAGGSAQGKILNLSSSEWDYVQDINLKSVFLVSKMLGNVMADRQRSENDRAIVNVSSLSGHKAGAHIPHYSAAKAAVMNFTRALAFELAPYKIRVNSVSPGFVETPLTEDGLQNERFKSSIERNTALQRVGKPEEIAKVIAFAASTDASYMTGTDLLVDGGWLIV